MPSQQRTTHRWHLVSIALAITVVAGACSHAQPRVAVRRPTTTTTGVDVLGNRVINAAPTADAVANRFTLADGTTVLVPVAAVAQGAEVGVKPVTPPAGSSGAFEVGPSGYEVSVTSGSIAKPIVVQVPVPATADRTDPIAVLYDTARRAWVPANGDVEDGSLTIYAAHTGTYAWMRWNWAQAASVAAETMSTVVGAPGGVDPLLSCSDTAGLAARFTTSAAAGEALRWCAGVVGGADTVQVANAAASPLALRTTGAGDSSTVRRRDLTDAVLAVARRHWSPSSGETIDVLAPGDRASFRLTPDVAAKASLAAGGLSQYYLALSGAAAFVAGLYAGSTDVGVTVLDDRAVLDAILADLDRPGCADGVAAAFTGPFVADDAVSQLVTPLHQLVAGCVSAATVGVLVNAASTRSVLRAGFGSAAATLPTSSERLLVPAITQAATALLQTLPAGDVSLAPVPPATDTSVDTVVPATTTPVTVAPVRDGGSPTTTTATTVAPTTTTRVTVPATTTTVAPTTTTTRPAATAPVVTIAPLTCSRSRLDLIAISGEALTPSGTYQLTITAPNGASSITAGTASAAGTIARPFSCLSQRQGTWTVRLRDNVTGQTSAPVTFEVGK